ncbi:MAG: hypothetical protein QM503_13135, partial [Bacteroidota bacterium]
KSYDFDIMTYLLPDYFPDNENRFHLFRYENNAPANSKEWDKLEEIENYYKNNRFSYKVQENKGVLYYTEYSNDEEIENIIFDDPEYAAVLKASQQQVLSFDKLMDEITEMGIPLSKKRLIEVLTQLKQSFLIYCTKDFSNVVSLLSL